MTPSQKNYADYLTRLSRTGTKTARDHHNEKLTRGVGESYGLSDGEMDQVVKELEDSHE